MAEPSVTSWRASALWGGGASTLAFLLVAVGIGFVGDRQAMNLLQSTLPTIRFLCSSAIGAAATVLALMVTVVGLSQRLDEDIQPGYFMQIRRIGQLCVAVMIGGVGLLLILTVPLSEADDLQNWYNTIYYLVLVVASLIGGGLVAITLSLRTAVSGLLNAAHPEAESSIFVDRDESEETREDASATSVS